ncbi:VWA domain-containing protein [Clostridium algoriphilum]|uniref:VWA domain-containing protein n=1 Tax=Clostridium algoriphilum TaxID=198347 RepID=UPI001CF5A510|nr:VWA domain-containing protein [Clostridium algoriphilum]MCB2293360.1 VWA domain-containing protein [Clostridium algoriphilum]
MFSSFFYLLRAKGLDTSLNEWITLIEALDKGLSDSSLTGFYYLCRAVLIKTEVDFDKFDEAFLEFFKDIKPSDKLLEELLKWLEHPKEKIDKPFDMERAELNKKLSTTDIEKMFKERIKEQKEEHNGGSYWVGTGGVSVFGNSGYSPNGIRVGGQSRHGSAFYVAGDRKFRDFRNDNKLDTRQFQVALRHLRQFSNRIDAPKTELDINGTIQKTSNNGGYLKLVYEKPRKNTVKVLLLMDSGGSMQYYSNLCSSLFQAVNKSNHFKDLKIYYFHNCIHPKIYADPTMNSEQAIDTNWIFHNISSEYKVIIVGDAMMEPSELTRDNYYNYGGVTDKMSPMNWLTRLKEKYKHIVWLNPIVRPIYYSSLYETYDILEKEFDMYKLSVKGLEMALKKLLVSR